MVLLPSIDELRAACEALPVFPLPGTVFLPHTALPLHVFEHRYRALIDHALEGNGIIGVPRLRPGWEANYEGTPDMFDVIGFGRIVHCERMFDGRANIVIAGVGRARVLHEIATDAPYRTIHCRDMEDDFSDQGPASLRRVTSRLRMMTAQLQGMHPDLAKPLGRLLEEQPEPVPFVNALAHLVLPDVEMRQAYIELDDIETRIERVEGLLASVLADGIAYA